MSERIITNEKWAVKAATIGVIGAAALTGCSATPSEIMVMNPVDRVAFEYINMDAADDFDFNDSTGCLDGTTYDVRAGISGRASYAPPAALYDSETDTLSLIPAQGPTLNLEGFDQITSTVSPADKTSLGIFASYGCVVGDYK